MSTVIIGTGHDLPERVLTNDDLEAMDIGFDRNRAKCSLEEWSMKRIGVHERHVLGPGQPRPHAHKTAFGRRSDTEPSIGR